jgi:transcriptional regulator GlxA family with amidase domain
MLSVMRVKAVKKLPNKNLHRRLDYARYLLTQTSEPIKRVAINCGWTNEKTFAAVFRTVVGVTPTHYRRWHQ